VQDRLLAKLSEGLTRFMVPNDDERHSVFNYRQIGEIVESILSDLQIEHLFVVLDEWAQIPLTAQPYVAEFIKRALLSLPKISLKLSAVNYQCKFAEHVRQSKASKSISIRQVNTASASWFSSEKESNINAEQTSQETLRYLLNNVLKAYKSRTFLVEAGKEDHPRLVRLLNERIIHRLNEVYSHPDRPGQRYELFTLDHGAYIRFRGTVNEPHQDLFFDQDSLGWMSDEEKKGIVPFDDKRSIRRIVFDPDKLLVEA